MRYEVLITPGAERDLAEIIEYIAEHDAAAKSDHVLGKLLAVIADLSMLPERGAFPKELLALGMRDFRQASFKPSRAMCRVMCRVMYRVLAAQVFILGIADGCRDLQALLARRLLSD